MQALAEVIRRLEDSLLVPFIFELEYDLEPTKGTTKRILISNRQTDTSSDEPGVPRAVVDGNEISQNDRLISKEFLPDNVLAFTTGNETEWLDIEEKFREQSSER